MPRRMVAAALAAALVTAACSGNGSSTTSTTGKPVDASPTTTAAAAPSPTDSGCPDLADDRGGLTPFLNVELAAHADTGAELWTIRLGAAFVREFAVSDGVVYASLKEGPLIAIDARTCAELWRVEPPVAATGFVIADGFIYGANSFDVAAYDVTDGRMVWRSRAAVLAGSVLVADQVAVAGDGVSVPLAGDSMLLGYGAADGAPRFSVPADGLVGIAADADAVYVASDAAVEARDPGDGTSLWVADLEMAAAFAPVIAGDSLIVAGRRGVTAIDRDTGAVLWVATMAADSVATPLVDAGRVSMLGVDGVLRTADLAAGKFETVATLPSCCAFAMPEESFVLVELGGTTTAFDIEGTQLWTVTTGANGRDRFTRAAVDAGVIVTATWSPRGAQ